uniref:Uncharacterized protein n=1 Tax=Arundo donax TaxID=35708 RepID=A0A0A9APU9_ARUDO
MDSSSGENAWRRVSCDQ